MAMTNLSFADRAVSHTFAEVLLPRAASPLAQLHHRVLLHHRDAAAD
jgi:hypothetical protein